MTQAAHSFKRMVQVIRQDSDPFHFPGWRKVALQRFNTGIMLKYAIPGSFFDNGEVGMIVDSNMNPVAVVDVDEQTNQYTLLSFPSGEESPILQAVFTAIEQSATEISEGAGWQ